MNLWRIRWLAVLALSGPTALWAQGPAPILAPSSAPPPARGEAVMPPSLGGIGVPPVPPNASPGLSARPSPLTLAQVESLAQTYNPILRRDAARIESARG